MLRGCASVRSQVSYYFTRPKWCCHDLWPVSLSSTSMKLILRKLTTSHSVSYLHRMWDQSSQKLSFQYLIVRTRDA